MYSIDHGNVIKLYQIVTALYELNMSLISLKI